MKSRYSLSVILGLLALSNSAFAEEKIKLSQKSQTLSTQLVRVSNCTVSRSSMVKGNTVYSFTVTENVKRKVWLEDQDGNLVGTVETVSEVSSRSIDTPMGNADNAKLACERLRKPFSETLAATPY